MAIKPLYVVRWLGGLFTLAGMGLMLWNLWHTADDARAHLIKPIPVPIPEPTHDQTPQPLTAASGGAS